MNKAFTKESDLDEDDEFDSAPPIKGKNYLTPAGSKRMLAELKDLKHRQRPELTKVIEWAAGNGDRSENGDYTYGKKKLREIDRRLRFLNKRLESAEVVDPLVHLGEKQIYFGATVTIRNEDDKEKIYSIVGVDEIDVAAGRISWLSPIGAALLRATEGEVIIFRSPKGPQEIEIVSVEYKELP